MEWRGLIRIIPHYNTTFYYKKNYNNFLRFIKQSTTVNCYFMNSTRVGIQTYEKVPLCNENVNLCNVQLKELEARLSRYWLEWNNHRYQNGGSNWYVVRKKNKNVRGKTVDSKFYARRVGCDDGTEAKKTDDGEETFLNQQHAGRTKEERQNKMRNIYHSCQFHSLFIKSQQFCVQFLYSHCVLIRCICRYLLYPFLRI